MESLKNKKSSVQSKIPLDSCVICNSSKNLKKMEKDYFIDGKLQNYSKMIEKCFKINFLHVSNNIKYLICEACIKCLRYCCKFREKVKLSYIQLYNKKNVRSSRIDVSQKNKLASSTKTSVNIKGKRSIGKLNNKLKIKGVIPKKAECNTENIPINKFPVNEQSLTNRSNYDNFMDCVDITNTENESDEDNWSTTSEQMKIATGYKQELEMCQQPPFIIPQLDPSLLQCPNCNLSFDTHFLLCYHYDQHFPNYLCDVCGKPYIHYNSFKVHLNSHLQSFAKFECNLCDRTFKYTNNLRHHIRSFHNKESSYKCCKCTDKFKNSISRRRHLLTVHNIQCKMYSCTVCDKKYISCGEFRRHMKTVHFKQRDYQCALCSYAFFKKSNLEDHMAKHTGISKHHCQFCQKALASRKSLKEHLKIHNNIKNYKCEICKKAFVQKSAWNSHMKTHLK